MNKATALIALAYLTVVYDEYQSGVSSLFLLQEDVKVNHGCLIFKPFSPFVETMDKKVMQLFESGLTSYWWNSFINPRGLKPMGDEIGPEVLTLEHLEIGFEACFVPLVVSIVVFVFEIMINWIQNKFIT